ncbi:MAG: fumarylacetoacetate hydrolase family protein [Pseudomonadota bacterium]
MRLLVGQVDGHQSVYRVDGDRAINLSSAVPGVGPDLAALVGDLALQAVCAAASGEGVAVGDIEPALPLSRPSTVLCLGLNYVEHIKEGGYDIPDYPALFMRRPQSLMAAGQPMVRPRCCEQLDYEAELMVIIGRGGRHIPESSALDHVFGYTVFNDGSVRAFQRKTHQWTPGKNFDATGAVGPHVVTADALPPGAAGLKIESRVGAEVLQSSNTANMIWSVAQAIAIVSEFCTLESGDMLAMGTPPGVGHAKKPNPRWLQPGERIDIEIESIGLCSSPVVDEAPAIEGAA